VKSARNYTAKTKSPSGKVKAAREHKKKTALLDDRPSEKRGTVRVK